MKGAATLTSTVRAGSIQPSLIPRVLLLVGAPVGFGLSSFGPAVPLVAAAVVALVAVVLRRNRPLLLLATGLAVGALAYLALGLIVVGEPGSGSGGG